MSVEVTTSEPDTKWARAGTVALWLLPFVIGFAAYKAAGHYRSGAAKSPATSADFANLQNLVQLTIAVAMGLATYLVLCELRLRQLSRQLDPLKQDTSVLRDALDDLREVQTFLDKDEGLSEAQKLLESAKNRIETMWTHVPYDQTLKDYFAKTLEEKIYTVRVVAVKTVPLPALLDHIDTSWEYLAGGTYELRLIGECDYEAMLADGVKAGFFLYSNEGYGGFFTTSTNPKFVAVVGGLLTSLLQGKRVPIDENDAKCIKRIEDWLRPFYDPPA